MTAYKLKRVTPAKQELLTGEMKVPALFFGAQGPVENQELLRSVEKIASDSAVSDHVAVLSDAHLKPRILSPTGAVVASETGIIPELLDAAPNCGMRVILTDLREEELSEEKINLLFRTLKDAVPSKKMSGTKISTDLALEVLRRGSRALEKDFSIRTRHEFENTYKQGDFFAGSALPSEVEIRSALPGPVIALARHRLGLLGATSSHFLHLMRISSVRNPGLANMFCVREGQYIFFLHTGSSIVGRYALSLYTPRQIKSISQKLILSLIRLLSRAHLKGIFSRASEAQSGLLVYRNDTDDLQRLETALRGVSNYGFANRTLITTALDRTLEEVLGRPAGLELLYDAPHVYADREEYSGKKFWIHRNGANRAFGPAKMKDHPLFRETGEPVLIAPFADGVGYLAVGTNENETAFSSANHEIGKAHELGLVDGEYGGHAGQIAAELEDNKLVKLVAEAKIIKTLTY